MKCVQHQYKSIDVISSVATEGGEGHREGTPPPSTGMATGFVQIWGGGGSSKSSLPDLLADREGLSALPLPQNPTPASAIRATSPVWPQL